MVAGLGSGKWGAALGEGVWILLLLLLRLLLRLLTVSQSSPSVVHCQVSQTPRLCGMLQCTLERVGVNPGPRTQDGYDYGPALGRFERWTAWDWMKGMVQDAIRYGIKFGQGSATGTA